MTGRDALKTTENANLTAVNKSLRRSCVRPKNETEARKAEAEQKAVDIKFMKKALAQAKCAARLGEVPIGCVIVHDGEVVGRGFNKRNTKKTTLAHAEITAIDRASRKLGDWRLEGCTMYVTLEPCQMCAGAIVQSRIDRVVIGAMNPKAGCAGSIFNLLDRPEFNHRVAITYDVCGDLSTEILQMFFKNLRERLRAEKEGRNEDGRV